MASGQQAGVDLVGKHMADQQRRHPFIQGLNVRQATAKHYHLWVKDVDH